MKEEEWLGGKNEGNDVGVCCCGYKIENEGDTRQASISIRIDSYPPYLGTFAREPILVKGSTSRRIMQLLELDVPIPKIAQKLAKRNSAERYTTIEVQSVIHTCSLLGLKGDSPYATESWENESIEGWWLKEDSYCESLLREQPITEKDCGYDCDDGWWKGRQCAGHRDWNRWACCSIGPEERRRERYRLYDLYGSDALRTGSDGSD
ncbi:hypothetical protein A1O7_05177 [Cladophialophora yegresii CBS 114405]|uniref:Uncharacterized protein n=1 Tax=Cladophialophora yegresii CBS 114405 TaxID=1182544 RepID=W9WRP4_9EURO|nr:uncharacterized protein A1O7_05177 [Cladophialophora yegresii CBS 114405]EXJ61024.1 hypothetical protein A1O7_05177 [Cladophialophora yegresii CBS 114405]